MSEATAENTEITPESVVFTNEQGQAIADPAAPSRMVPASEMVLAKNASQSGSLLIDERLTSFSVGSPRDEIEQLAEFVAPMVDAPLAFDYTQRNAHNQFGVVEDDLVGVNGMPALVQMDADTNVSSKLLFRGAELQMSQAEAATYDAQPGWSAAQEWQDQQIMLMDMLRRGRAKRVIAAMAAAAGSATAKTWDSSGTPLQDLDAYIEAIAILAGGRQNVKILFGRTAFRTMRFQKQLAGANSDVRLQPATLQYVADQLMLPVQNLMVSYNQVESAKAGKTSSKTDLFSATNLYIFAGSQQPSRRDYSFMKTFVMRQGAGPYQVYDYNPHPLFVRKGTVYWERILATNSAAVTRLNIAAE